MKDSPRKKPDQRLAALGLFCIGVYFYRLTRPALRSGFSPDDCMNLYRSWYFPLADLFKANVLFFLPSDFIRPMGSVWYRAIYYFAGFRPAPFHAVEFVFLLANIALVYLLARRLADSRFAGLVTALLFAYQERWASLYFDTGYVYDVLCGFFLFAALLLYVRTRQSGRTPRALETAAVLALFICALNSKEMAVALPVVVALYEVLWQKRRYWTATAITAPMTAAFIVGRAMTLTSNAAYKPQYSWTRLMETSSHFLSELSGGHEWFAPWGVVVLVAALLAVALGARSASMIYAWGFTIAAALPIAFVPPRGGSQYYIPLFGCALYVGSLLALLGQRLARMERTPAWAVRAAAACTLLAIAWPIYSHGKYVALRGITSITEESPLVMSVAARLRQLHPTLPSDARLVFLNDPIYANVEDLLFIVRLAYRDRTIEVERVKRTQAPPTGRQMQAYDGVFDYGPQGLTEVTRPPLNLHPRIQAFFDADWQPITATHMAKPGSRVIAYVSDLGPTRPEVAPGSPFPRDPLATSLVRLQATVDGKPAPVVTQLGNPGDVNIYRVDFVVPKATRAGSLNVQIAAAGSWSPPAALPVAR